MAAEYRAVHHYPEPMYGPKAFRVGYGPPRETREMAERDGPWRPEETHGYRVGIQVRQVSEWSDE